MRCNCTFCQKARFWVAFAKEGEFRLLRGEDALVDFQRVVAGKTEPFLHFQFCRTCGVRGFTKGGVLPQFGGSFHAVNVACLDDATDEELAAAPIHYADGRNNDWDHATKYRYL